MKGFLIFLAIAFPIAMLSPGFWMLVEMEFAALPITLTYQDGRRQESTTGPKSHWPYWAVVPAGADLTVRAWYAASPPEPATGFGDFTHRDTPTAAALAYADRLRADGWQVDAVQTRAFLPTIPRTEYVACDVRALFANGRVLLATFEIAPQPGAGRLFWATAPNPSYVRANGGPC